ncbi:MAG: InlB B-repeat-containing protein [Tenericutes bacterium]|nr:InlB B-repeat-containing protein [Mycoplasmatota bacterium]
MKNDKKTSSVSFNIDGKIETIKIENNTKIKFIKEPVKDGFIFAIENK